jgi:hypothetical protein
MSEPTPGPWEWWTSNSWKRLRHTERGVSTNVLMPCRLPDGGATIDVTDPDMDLIMAAPALQDALENLVIGISMGWDLDGLIVQAHHALAKSRGVTP